MKNMAGFRNNVGEANLKNWWSNDQRQFAFARQGKGFVVINAGKSQLSLVISTSLPKGTYCDVISGDYMNGVCTGKTVYVNDIGQANFRINSQQQEPMIAIHVGKKTFQEQVFNTFKILCIERLLKYEYFYSIWFYHITGAMLKRSDEQISKQQFSNVFPGIIGRR